MAISVRLLFCSYKSIYVHVQYLTLDENRKAEEQITDSCTCSLNITKKIKFEEFNFNLSFLQCIGVFISFVYSVSADRLY
jgi:hypothetical protein